jgi:hypothetical protein
VAYRQLCAVTFVMLGLVAVGCGGNTTTTAGGSASPGDQQPPTNHDQAPSSSDKPPSASDQAPASGTTPPSSADSPAGGGGGGHLGQLCQQLCSSLAGVADRCSNGMSVFGMDKVCSKANTCQVPANFPCQNEAAALFSCLIDNLDALCVHGTDSSGQGGSQGQQGPAPTATTCQDVLKTFTSCAAANAPPTPTPGTGTGKNCTSAGGCDCPNNCMKCQCQAGRDITKLQACGTSNACTMP